MNDLKKPEGDRIYDLYTGVYKPQIIRIALGLDVFSPLHHRAGTAEAVAKACQCEVVGIRHLLNYLVSLNLLKCHDDSYSLSQEADTFLVRGKKSYAGDLIMDFVGPGPWENLRGSIQSGFPNKIDLETHFEQDAWIESYRSGRLPGSLEMWRKAGVNPGPSLRLRLLDLACGCAIKSMALAEKSPGVQLTCLDSPRVLEVARDLAMRMGILSQVSFMAGDLLSTELGDARYDVCLLGQITHYLTSQQNQCLFVRIKKSLAPGGKLILDVPMATGQLDESTSFLSLILWANSGGQAYSFMEYRSWLLEAGFITIIQLSERLLSAAR